ncbi:nitrate- and nitrite sensing domain-containing protein [Thauera butanivorans]|uniref:nitrate- and nitrite sensing domain-containing protein n=1 Tax=Thauera butanivorans TaxID=86174 RepID=UPI003AB6DADB
MKTALAFLLAARRCEIDDLERLALSCELVQAVSELVHQLQRERGASNVFLGSEGARFGPQREAQLLASRAAEAGVRSWLKRPELGGEKSGGAVHGGARLLTRIALALHALDGLPGLRGDIAARRCRPDASTARYGEIIAALLALVFEAADVAVDPGVSRLLVALFNLMQGKEFAGQERALGAALFAAGHPAPERVQAILHLIDAQAQCFRRFEGFCGDEVLRQWRALQSVMPLAEHERLRRMLLASTLGSALDPALAEAWFDCCSQRLDQMHEAEVALARGLGESCARRIASARTEAQDQAALLEALSTAAEIRAPLDMLIGTEMAGEGAPAEPAQGDGPFGPQLRRSIVDLLHAQSQRLQAMSDELDAARAALDERKLIERAKGLLMACRGLSEDEAYRLLRQTAMSQGRRLAEVAAATLALAPVLGRH